MVVKKFGLAAAALAMFAAPLPTISASARDDGIGLASLNATQDAALLRQLSAIVSEMPSARVGITAIDMDSGRQVSINGDQPFPMASTVKIAVAATFLDMVDQGTRRLDQSFPLMIRVAGDTADGRAAVRPGMSLTAQSLIELSITKSDNQATDALIAAVGGTRAVTAWLQKNSLSGLRIDRDIATLVRDDSAKNDPLRMVDRRDTSTPQAMVHVLTALYRGDVLSAQSRAVLLGAMSRCQTGRNRLKALLPQDTLVAHKTGTLWGQTSDVGFIRLPDGRNMAIAVYVAGQQSHTAHAGTIAAVARTVYDNFTPTLASAAAADRSLAAR
ncbi:class A beta-lactamase [Novosphingobium tardum]|uniref:Beta-lactamase n=1 Tax=Novosphingobium tardum TaxID=1538021 RepID=A0ABV8RL66_9SPHN